MKHPGARFGMRRLVMVSAVVPVLLLAACGNGNSPSGNSASGTSPLLVGVIAPFTGVDAALGPAYYAACLPASLTINNNGGIMGHPISCQQFDTRGEPADAVPAARQMVASHSNLIAAVGCTSDEASSVAPIINGSKIDVLHDRPVGVQQDATALLPSPGPAGSVRRLRDGRQRHVPEPLDQDCPRLRQ